MQKLQRSKEADPTYSKRSLFVPCKSCMRHSSISHACWRPIDRRWNEGTMEGELFSLRRDDLFQIRLRSISLTFYDCRRSAFKEESLFLFFALYKFSDCLFVSFVCSFVCNSYDCIFSFLLSFFTIILSQRIRLDRIEILSLHETTLKLIFRI